MEYITNLIQSLPFNMSSFVIAALVLLLGTILSGVLGRFIFGKRSNVNHAVSSAVGVLFLYAITIVVKSAAFDLSIPSAPLPYVNFTDTEIILFSFRNAHFTEICQQILSLIILAFLVNLTDSLLPKGKNLFLWLIFRIFTIIIAYALHLLAVYLFTTFLPQAITTYAPVILLGILIVLILTGAFKILIGAAIATVNPIIGALYTFFFANIIGKQITKAVLTSLIITILLFALHLAGIHTISFIPESLIAYVPFALILMVLWYLFFKIL